MQPVTLALPLDPAAKRDTRTRLRDVRSIEVKCGGIVPPVGNEGVAVRVFLEKPDATERDSRYSIHYVDTFILGTDDGFPQSFTVDIRATLNLLVNVHGWYHFASPPRLTFVPIPIVVRKPPPDSYVFGVESVSLG